MDSLNSIKDLCFALSIKFSGANDALDALDCMMDTHINLIIIHTNIGEDETQQLIEMNNRDESNQNTPIIIISDLKENENLAKKIASYQVISFFSHKHYIAQLTNLLHMLYIQESSIALLKQELFDSEEKNVIDPLTGAYNRNGARNKFQHLVSRYERHNEKFSIIMLDIDFFKRVNDTYGHDVGDEVLIELSALIQKSIRRDDSLIRLGGEEFVILIADIDLLGADEVAQKLRRVLCSKRYSSRDLVITCSFGVAEYQANQSCESLLKHADELLYIAKNEGRDRVISFRD